MPGAITVAGHTDNVPIKNGGMYRSNWDLSAARAASVAHELLAAGVEPVRLEVSGHADTQTRALRNDTNTRASGRQNRRVDISFNRRHSTGTASGLDAADESATLRPSHLPTRTDPGAAARSPPAPPEGSSR
jgi:chemotaxis protein MotB